MNPLAYGQHFGAPLGIAKAVIQRSPSTQEMAAMVLSIRSTGFAQPERLSLNRTFALAAAIAVNLGGLLLLSLTGLAPTARLPMAAVPIIIEDIRPREVLPPVPAIPDAPDHPEEVVQRRVEILPTPEQVTAPPESVVLVNSTPVSTRETQAPPASAGPAASSNREAGLAYGEASPPPYPRIALSRGWEGTVMLLVLVAADGSVEDVRVDRSSGHRALDQQALRHVRRNWRFQPAWRDGQAIAAWASVPVVFKLD
ncbi:MAG: energy transducer TonB [Pseudomarimonas sp.]